MLVLLLIYWRAISVFQLYGQILLVTLFEMLRLIWILHVRHVGQRTDIKRRIQKEVISLVLFPEILFVLFSPMLI